MIKVEKIGVVVGGESIVVVYLGRRYRKDKEKGLVPVKDPYMAEFLDVKRYNLKLFAKSGEKHEYATGTKPAIGWTARI